METDIEMLQALHGDAFILHCRRGENKGIVVVYREFNKGTSNAYQINLPRIFPMTDSGNGEVYSQIIDFSYLPQQVEIAVTNSDLKYDLKTKPESMDFRLSMMY